MDTMKKYSTRNLKKSSIHLILSHSSRVKQGTLITLQAVIRKSILKQFTFPIYTVRLIFLFKVFAALIVQNIK